MKNLANLKKGLLKFFSKVISQPVRQISEVPQNFPGLSSPIILFPVQKKFFRTIWKFDPKSYLLRIFEKLEFWKTLWPKNYSHQVFLKDFSGILEFQKFLLNKFSKVRSHFWKVEKKILLSKKFRILRRKWALVGKIKSFTVTSGLRISKFRTVCPNEWFLDFEKPCQFEKRASKIFFKGHFSARETNFRGATKLSWLVFTHHFVSSPKKIFSNNLKIWPKILFTENFWKIGILKNPLAKKLFTPSILKRFFRDFGISKIFIK